MKGLVGLFAIHSNLNPRELYKERLISREYGLENATALDGGVDIDPCACAKPGHVLSRKSDSDVARAVLAARDQI